MYGQKVEDSYYDVKYIFDAIVVADRLGRWIVAVGEVESARL
jgi:hypothetical protein